MDPLSILRTAWRHRLLAVPVVALTVLGAVYVLFLGPRVYQSNATYVLVNPQVPTAEQIDRDSRLARLNSDNPYLRSSDPSLIVQVMAAKLSAKVTAQAVLDAGLGPDYSVAQSSGNSLMLVITGSSGTAEGALATTGWLTDQLQEQLRSVQQVNGADDAYLYTALPVDVDTTATEKLSSRLRSLILVGMGGAVLLFGVVSLGVARERRPPAAPASAALDDRAPRVRPKPFAPAARAVKATTGRTARTATSAPNGNWNWWGDGRGSTGEKGA